MLTFAEVEYTILIQIEYKRVRKRKERKKQKEDKRVRRTGSYKKWTSQTGGKCVRKTITSNKLQWSPVLWSLFRLKQSSYRPGFCHGFDGLLEPLGSSHQGHRSQDADSSAARGVLGVLWWHWALGCFMRPTQPSALVSAESPKYHYPTGFPSLQRTDQ